MVEMTETAEILQKMTSRSLVIFDEIGRGTSTFDGMSLAQSILEYVIGQKKSMTLFATHYHELTSLEARFSDLQNGHMSVVEKNGEIRFLHTLTKGPALKSYGIQVAKLAGLPAEVTQRASEVLKQTENSKFKTPPESLSQMSLFEASLVAPPKALGPQVEVLEDLKQWPLQKKSPLEALNQIALWQHMIS